VEPTVLQAAGASPRCAHGRVPRPRHAVEHVEGGRYLFFTNECVGLGHWRRTLALAQEVTARDPSASALIATGTAAAAGFPLGERIEVLGLPALARDQAGAPMSPRLSIPPSHLQSLRSQVALAAADSFRPDVVVVDKTPLGIGGELLPMLRSLRQRGRSNVVLGLRDIEDDPARVRQGWQAAGMRDAIETYYDAVCVYGPELGLDALACAGWSDLSIPVHHVGYVASAAAPASSSVADDPYLLVTTGGGVDGVAVADAVLGSLRRRPIGLRTLVLAGPLMPAEDVARLQDLAADLDVTVERFRSDAHALIAGARAVVCMAGYNTVAEVLLSGTPALVVPRTRPSREQLLRAELLGRAGLVEVLLPDLLAPAAVGAALDRVLARPRLRAADEGYDGAARAAGVLSHYAAAPRCCSPTPLLAMAQ